MSVRSVGPVGSDEPDDHWSVVGHATDEGSGSLAALMGALPPTAVDAKTLEDLFEFAAFLAWATADRAALNSFTRELFVIQGSREALLSNTSASGADIAEGTCATLTLNPEP